MEERFRFESFGRRHLRLRGAFSCGDEDLDRYLRERARRELEQRVAAVRVLYDAAGDRIAGYYTLGALAIERADLPAEISHRISRYRVYPATLVGRLAVDLEYQSQRLGGALLLDALRRALVASQEVAAVAVVTDAKDQRSQPFYERYGFQPLLTERSERRLFLPMRTVERLFEDRGS